jgi:hypothetical protein
MTTQHGSNTTWYKHIGHSQQHKGKDNNTSHKAATPVRMSLKEEIEIKLSSLSVAARSSR